MLLYTEYDQFAREVVQAAAKAANEVRSCEQRSPFGIFARWAVSRGGLPRGETSLVNAYKLISGINGRRNGGMMAEEAIIVPSSSFAMIQAQGKETLPLLGREDDSEWSGNTYQTLKLPNDKDWAVLYNSAGETCVLLWHCTDFPPGERVKVFGKVSERLEAETEVTLDMKAIEFA